MRTSTLNLLSIALLPHLRGYPLAYCKLANILLT